MTALSATVIGGGVFGLWQAYTLARRGHAVTLHEAMTEEQTGGASRFAGAMLAPYCESEAAEPIVRDLGLRGLELWLEAYPGTIQRGSLVVAAARDRSELTRFARMTQGHVTLADTELSALEPELAGRFVSALHYPTEGHVVPRQALAFLVGQLKRMGATLHFRSPVGEPVWQAAPAGEVVIDCRGLAAREDLSGLRGVRGEMAVVRATDIQLQRPIRLLHPRFPLYVVPWGEGIYMIGATLIEREDMGPVTVRSALDLLGTAYALHPGFGEAEIVELSSGVRPSFADNVPRIVASGRRLHVNGAYRHGYLLAPALAEITADFLERGESNSPAILRAGGNVV